MKTFIYVLCRYDLTNEQSACFHHSVVTAETADEAYNQGGKTLLAANPIPAGWSANDYVIEI